MRKELDTLSLPVVLNADELAQTSKQLASTINERARIDDALKAHNASVKAELKERDARIKKLSRLIETGEEIRDVECDVTFDFATNRKTWTRTDTKKVVRTAPIPPEDRQEEMKLTADKKKQTADAGKSPKETKPKAKGKAKGKGEKQQDAKA